MAEKIALVMLRLPRLLLAALPVAAILASPSSAAQTTHRASVSTAGLQGNNRSIESAISADGYWIAFSSEASNLVPHDGNGVSDVFLHHRRTGETVRASVRFSGEEGDGPSGDPAISADGNLVAFVSEATNLLAGDLNGVADVFLRHRGGLIWCASSGANGASRQPAISADGACVAFASWASNLVPGDTNNHSDVFVYSWPTGVTRVSVDSAGMEVWGESRSPSISADGRFIAFRSNAPTLVAGDTNQTEDVFVHDRLTGITEMVSVSSTGVQGNEGSFNPSISADGRCVSFWSDASNLLPADTNHVSDVFVHDRFAGSTTRVSVSSSGGQADFYSYYSTLSADGRFVAFHSLAGNLTGDRDQYYDLDCYLHDRETGQTSRVNLEYGELESRRPSISADGRFVAYESFHFLQVPGDTNGAWDVFVRDRGPGTSAELNTIVVSGELFPEIGQLAYIHSFAAPPGAHAWLLASYGDAGSTIGGHAFGVGPGVRTIEHRFCDGIGNVNFRILSLPAWTAGRTLYFEVGARGADGKIHDSNTLERIVQ